MNIIKSVIYLMALICHSIAAAQALTSAMADGNSTHTVSGSSVISSSSSTSSRYSTSEALPAKARAEEAFAFQLQQAKEIAIAINARRMQNINNQMRSVKFNNPFGNSEPQTGFTDWSKEKYKFDNNADNQDYSALSIPASSRYRYMPGYVNHNNILSKMSPSTNKDFTQEQVETQNSEDIKKEYLVKVADETIDKTIDEIEDEDVKSRMKSIKEIHNETYDLWEKMIDDFFKPFPQDLEDRIDRFFGNYKSKVLLSFAKANSYIREKEEESEKYAPIGEMMFNKYNTIKL